jgi:hypothetical protein
MGLNRKVVRPLRPIRRKPCCLLSWVGPWTADALWDFFKKNYSFWRNILSFQNLANLTINCRGARRLQDQQLWATAVAGAGRRQAAAMQPA